MSQSLVHERIPDFDTVRIDELTTVHTGKSGGYAVVITLTGVGFIEDHSYIDHNGNLVKSTTIHTRNGSKVVSAW